MTPSKPPIVMKRADITPRRRVFCNRTLNLRSIKAIGYDMDYTLIHYRVDRWERRSFSHMKRKLRADGWPVDELRFDAEAFQRGLIIDLQLGNILKANQFGYIKKASHGTAMLDFDTLRKTYAETLIDLSEPRFIFLNTLFSLSEASMYAQLVDLLDSGASPEVMGYTDLYDLVRRILDEAHMEGRLKAEIVARPQRFVVLDPEIPRVLLDQREAGKKLLLITNSEWPFSHAMMTYAFDRYLPAGMTWRDLFDVTFVSARKPHFFYRSQPAFEVVSDDGMLLPLAGKAEQGTVLLGGHAGLVESMLKLGGSQILYVGDHAYGDVHVSKSLHRWRTALVVRELEDEVAIQESFVEQQHQIAELMEKKRELEFRQSQLRLLREREESGGPASPRLSGRALKRELGDMRESLRKIDEELTPLAVAASSLSQSDWGLLMHAGGDKSYLARQVERHADIYTSRVSNLLYETPYAFFRPRYPVLPHEPT